MIVAHDPAAAQQAAAKRDALIAALQDKTEQWASKLDAQDAGKRGRGRKLCDGGARERFYHEVAEAHLARIIRVDMDSELFTCDINEQALVRAKLMDGKLLLTNVKDLTPPEIVKRYESLANIERGFRVLKSEIKIGRTYGGSSPTDPVILKCGDCLQANSSLSLACL